jgi:hypothetical protein
MFQVSNARHSPITFASKQNAHETEKLLFLLFLRRKMEFSEVRLSYSLFANTNKITKITNTNKITCIAGFEVLTAVSTKMAVFWVVAPSSLVEVYQRFRGPCCLHHQGDNGGIKDL